MSGPREREVPSVSQRASYEGPALDGTVQYLSEAPFWRRDGETVDVVDDRVDAGDERAENVPVPGEDDDVQEDVDRPDRDGQTTLDDWGRSP